MPKNKVVLLATSVFGIGGIQTVSRTLAKVLNETFDNFEVLSLNDSNNSYLEKYIPKKAFLGFTHHRIKFTLFALRKTLNAKIVVINHVHLLPIMIMISSFVKSKRIIMLAHGIEVWKPLPKYQQSFLRKRIEIWAVSHYTAHQLANKLNLAIDQIKILNNCLDPYFEIPKKLEKPKELCAKYKLNLNDPVLFTLARLNYAEQYKGYDLALNSLPLLIGKWPNIKYILGGYADDQEKLRLEQLIDKLKIKDNVLLTGLLAEEDITYHYLLADIFVMPSKNEGFGITYIEAAACGCPSIAGDQDGSKDALLFGKLGLHVNPEHINEFAEAVHKLLYQQPKKEIIQADCLAHFSYQKYKQKVNQLLQLK